MIIGKIIRLNAHADYVCQVRQVGEVDEPPASADYGVGSFVRVGLPDMDGTWLVGLIYNTVIFGPGMGMLGPRLVPPEEIEMLSPDLMGETATLLGIAAVGSMGANGSQQGLPQYSPSAHCLVETMTDDAIHAFHDTDRGMQLSYTSFLLGQYGEMMPQLLMHVIEQLAQLFPDHQRHLKVLRNDIVWRSTMQGWAG